MNLTKKGVWKNFSLYVRLRDSDQRGYCSCISCGTIKHYKECQAGHFIHNKNIIFFDEDNVHAQCVRCNQYLHGNLYYYGKTLEQKIGKSAINRLLTLKNKHHRFNQTELKLINEYCKEEIRKYKKEKLI